MFSVRWILSALKDGPYYHRARHHQPECEAKVDEDDHRPDDKEGEGRWEDTWVEAHADGVPQKKKLFRNQKVLYFSVAAFIRAPPSLLRR